MREIKFRAWDENIKKMYYQPNYHLFLDMDGKVHNFQNGEILKPLLSTGLHDRNGKEIFEGDIVKIREIDSPREYFIEKVEKDERGFWPFTKVSGFIDMDYVYSIDPIDIEIIGNVFENPNLVSDK